MRIVAGVLIAFLLAAGVVVLLWRHNACTNQVLRITETSGIRFVIERSSCDLLGKDEAVSVYATTVSGSPLRGLLGWFGHRALLFRYDPGSVDNPLPTIVLPTSTEIHVMIPSVSSILVQRRNWDGKAVSFDIGKIYFPDPSNDLR